MRKFIKKEKLVLGAVAVAVEKLRVPGTVALRKALDLASTTLGSDELVDAAKDPIFTRALLNSLRAELAADQDLSFAKPTNGISAIVALLPVAAAVDAVSALAAANQRAESGSVADTLAAPNRPAEADGDIDLSFVPPAARPTRKAIEAAADRQVAQAINRSVAKSATAKVAKAAVVPARPRSFFITRS